MVRSSKFVGFVVAALAGAPLAFAAPAPAAGPSADKHAGEVLFSSKPFDKSAGDDSTLYTQYNLGDPLYMRYFAKDSAANYAPKCDHGDFHVDVDFNLNGAADGKKLDEMPGFTSTNVGKDDVDVRLLGSLSNKLALAFTTPTEWLLDRNKLADAEDQPVRTFNAIVVPALKDGDNSLKIVVALRCGPNGMNKPMSIAEGTLTISVKPGTQHTYLAKYGPKLPKSPSKENAKLVPEIKKAMAGLADWSSTPVVGALVTADDWEPIRNDLGRLIAKDITAIIVVRDAKGGAESCRLFDMTFRRDASGGALYREGTGGSTPFPCSSAPKYTRVHSEPRC